MIILINSNTISQKVIL